MGFEGKHHRDSEGHRLTNDDSFQTTSKGMRSHVGSKKVKIHSILVQPSFKSTKLSDEKERKARIESQTNDRETFARNKRLFGSLLVGTLERFKSEEDHRIKAKPPRQAKLHVESPRSEKSREAGSTDSSEVSLKPELANQNDFVSDVVDAQQRFDNWKNVYCRLGSFLQTEAEPRIFWSPKKHSRCSEILLDKTRQRFAQLITEKEKQHIKLISKMKHEDTRKSYTPLRYRSPISDEEQPIS